MRKFKNYGIILASGSGSRYGADIPKQFVKIAGKTILEHTIEIFEKSQNIDEIIIVITPEYRIKAEDVLLKNNYKKISKILNGGETRKESSYIGISSIEDEDANVVIHDCARPFLSQRIIDDCVNALKKYDAIDVAIPSADTIIKIKDNIIEDIPERATLRRGQTPQCFKLSLIKKAHELSKNDKNFTDDCGLIVKYNLGKVFVVEGDTENIGLKELKDKVIVIFGGTSGIGEATANLAKEYNAKVYTPSLRNDCDITNYSQIEKYLKQVFNKEQKIDYVINSAGILSMGKLVERKIEDIQKDINVNYIGAINVVKAAIPYIKQTKGSIQLYASSSYTRGRALYSTYSSTKAGIVNLVQALAEELYSEKIRINVINPERTATPMRFKAFGKEPKSSLLQPEKVAEASLKTLISNLTGQVIDVKKN